MDSIWFDRCWCKCGMHVNSSSVLSVVLVRDEYVRGGICGECTAVYLTGLVSMGDREGLVSQKAFKTDMTFVAGEGDKRKIRMVVAVTTSEIPLYPYCDTFLHSSSCHTLHLSFPPVPIPPLPCLALLSHSVLLPLTLATILPPPYPSFFVPHFLYASSHSFLLCLLSVFTSSSPPLFHSASTLNLYSHSSFLPNPSALQFSSLCLSHPPLV